MDNGCAAQEGTGIVPAILNAVRGRKSRPIEAACDPDPSTSASQPIRAHWLQSILDRNVTSRIWLADTLAQEVFLHLAMNLDPLFVAETPQILILNGPFGVGKTVSLDETLSRCGCEKVRIQASELESPHAGVPAERIREAYMRASRLQGERDRPHALVIDDIHLGLGVDANTTKTINTQLVVAALMGICDDPLHVGKEPTERIPIFATANDLTHMCGALLRPGRARVIAVELSGMERQRIVTHILRDFLTPEQAARLCAACPTWSIAAFRQLKGQLLRRSFDRRHQGRTAEQILKDLMTPPQAAPTLATAASPVNPEELDRAALALDSEAAAKRDFTREAAAA